MPLLCNNMPLSGNKDGLLSMQKNVCFFAKKVAEMFGGFADFLYLCSVVVCHDDEMTLGSGSFSGISQ